MTKQDYLNELAAHLRKFSATEQEEILADYREHFTIAEQNGKSVDEIIKSLGSPRSVAQGYQVDSLVREVKESPNLLPKLTALGKMLLIFVALAPFNFIVFLGPFVIIAALLTAGWSLPIATAAASVGLFFAFVANGLFTIGVLKTLSLFFLFLGSVGISILTCLLMAALTAWFVKFVISFIRWNVQFVTGKRA